MPMTDHRHQLRRRWLHALAAVAASVSLLGAVGVSTASAVSETFMSNQGLSAGNAKASVGANAGSYVVVWGVSDHSWCPSLARGYAGYTSSPNTSTNTTTYRVCGPGYQTDAWDTGGWSWHGAAWNRNVSTFDNFDHAIILW